MRKFLFWNILGAFLWATIYLTIGFFFGAYARDIEKVVSDIGLLITGIIFIGAVVYYFKYIKNRTK